MFGSSGAANDVMVRVAGRHVMRLQRHSGDFLHANRMPALARYAKARPRLSRSRIQSIPPPSNQPRLAGLLLTRRTGRAEARPILLVRLSAEVPAPPGGGLA